MFVGENSNRFSGDSYVATESHRPLVVLLIEDSSSDALIFRKVLERSDGMGRFHLVWVQKISDANTYLNSGKADLIVLDLNLPDSNGIESLRTVNEIATHIPVVVLTGMHDQNLAKAALTQGAEKYVVKGSFNTQEMVAALYGAVNRPRSDVLRYAASIQDPSMMTRYLANELPSPKESDLRKKLEMRRRCWSWRFFCSEDRMYPRYIVYKVPLISGKIHTSETEMQLATLSLEGCGFIGNLNILDNPSKKMRLSFQLLDQQGGETEITARHIYTTERSFENEKVPFQGFRFVESDTHRIVFLIEYLEKLEFGGKIISE